MSQKRPKKIHGGVTRGKKVLIITRDGEYVTERFLGSKAGRVLLETRSIPYHEIRTLTIARMIPRIIRPPKLEIVKVLKVKRRPRPPRISRGGLR